MRAGDGAFRTGHSGVRIVGPAVFTAPPVLVLVVMLVEVPVTDMEGKRSVILLPATQ